MSNRDKFAAVYREKLAAAHARKPDDYFWPISELDTVADKMLAALANGTAHVSGSPAVKAACKALDIPCKMAAIRDFLREGTP